jgi:hypothetical protein
MANVVVVVVLLLLLHCSAAGLQVDASDSTLFTEILSTPMPARHGVALFQLFLCPSVPSVAAPVMAPSWCLPYLVNVVLNLLRQGSRRKGGV